MQQLYIYNTIDREKQVFKPILTGVVKLYVCGMTVYDYCHLGHARVMVVFDFVRRWLRAKGYRVIYVRNITDIDDKIISRSIEKGISIKELTNQFIDAMQKDSIKLGIESPDIEPRATDYIPQMLYMIDKLVAGGYAYIAKDGNVNYSIRKFHNYGKLSGKSLNEITAGRRVKINESKHDPLDFVLWKRAKPNDPIDSIWPSRWGPGRPGWHIECSAMSTALLGMHFDIHGGGQDLQFPHHENEIAQSKGVNGKDFVNYWMHNGHVQISGEKMSKSLGNFYTIREILEHYNGEVIRFFIARVHYRSPLIYSINQLDAARVALERLYTALDRTKPEKYVVIDWSSTHARRFACAMNDDFNTAEAIAVLFELASEVNKKRNSLLSAQLQGLAGCLGFLQSMPRAFLERSDTVTGMISISEIEALLEIRHSAKTIRDFAKADSIRRYLFDKGVVLEDNAIGVTKWRRIG